MAVTENSFHWLPQGQQRRYFCSARCKARFAGAPAKFTAVASVAAPLLRPSGAWREAAVLRRFGWMFVLAVALAGLLFVWA